MSDHAASSRYTVVSIDNASFGSGGRRSTKREFGDAEAAVAYAQGLIDGALGQQVGAAKSAQELMILYTMSGSEVPKIFGEPRVDFHAYRYARERSEGLFAPNAG